MKERKIEDNEKEKAKEKEKTVRTIVNVSKKNDKELVNKSESKISNVKKNKLITNKDRLKLKAGEIFKEECNDIDCPIHGKLKVRGRIFKGKIIKKFHKRIAIEFGRMVYIRKYERYAKSKTKIHARLPICMEDKISIGDYVKVQECRPLSKLIHFVVIEKIKGEAEKAGGEK